MAVELRPEWCQEPAAELKTITEKLEGVRTEAHVKPWGAERNLLSSAFSSGNHKKSLSESIRKHLRTFEFKKQMSEGENNSEKYL